MAALGTDLTARLHDAVGDRAADTCQLEKDHLHRTKSQTRTRALQLRFFPLMEASSGLGEGPESLNV